VARNHDDDSSDVPEGGKAGARQRQFMESRGLISDEDEAEEEESGQSDQGEQARGETDNG
jgi:hypothetical protein